MFILLSKKRLEKKVYISTIREWKSLSLTSMKALVGLVIFDALSNFGNWSEMISLTIGFHNGCLLALCNANDSSVFLLEFISKFCQLFKYFKTVFHLLLSRGLILEFTDCVISICYLADLQVIFFILPTKTFLFLSFFFVVFSSLLPYFLMIYWLSIPWFLWISISWTYSTFHL